MMRSYRRLVSIGIVIAGILACPMPAAAEEALPNPFFAYCVGIGVGKESATLQAQLEMPQMLADLDYAGMAYVGLDGAPAMLEALERHGRKLFAVYTPVSVDPGNPGYDARLKDLIPRLKGHGTTVWLVINSKKYQPSSTKGDDRAVELLREIADAARGSGLQVSLYPHRGSYSERMEDVVRLLKKAQRPNIGVTFTLCHFLAVDDEANIERVLEMARPHLTMAVINGTSGYDPKNREGWILTLDDGTFDVSGVLRILHKLDFKGPIGMIAYGIKGDRRDILSRSIDAWKKLSARAVSDEK